MDVLARLWPSLFQDGEDAVAALSLAGCLSRRVLCVCVYHARL